MSIQLMSFIKCSFICTLFVVVNSRVILLEEPNYKTNDKKLEETQGIASILSNWYGPQRHFGDHPLHVTLSPDEIYRPAPTSSPLNSEDDYSLEKGYEPYVDSVHKDPSSDPLSDDYSPGYLDYYEPDTPRSSQNDSIEAGEEFKDILKDRKFYIFYLNDTQKVVQEIDGKNFTVYLDFDEPEIDATISNSTPSNVDHTYGPYVHPFPTSGYELSHPERIIVLEDSNLKPSSNISSTIPSQDLDRITLNFTSNVDQEMFDPQPHHKSLHDRCVRPLVNAKPCGDIKFMWFYDIGNNQCFEFLYGGCEVDESSNIFQSQSQCSDLCVLKDEEFVW